MAESNSPFNASINDAASGAAPGIPLNSALGVDARAFAETWQMILHAASRQPLAVFEALRTLNSDLLAVLMGRSDRQPAPGDKRFSAQQWETNPLYQRLEQAYLAWSASLDTWLERSGLEGIQHDRARFVLNAARDVLAPVNTLFGNPEAMRRLIDSRGKSVLQGVKNFLDDVRHNHGYPAVADRNAFKVGRDVAATEGAVIYRTELLELIQYQPKTEEVTATPFLYVFSQVNRFYLGDLTPDRSLFQKLLDAGIPVFAISWRNPEKRHRDWNLDTYAEGIIQAIEVIREVTGVPKIHLMGLCAGGLTATAAAGVLNARGVDWIQSLSLFVNILDNRVEDSDFGLFVSERSVDAQKQMTRVQGLFDEKNVFEMFAMLRLEENVMNFFRSNYLLGEAPPKHPLLFWSMDYTRLPAGLHAAFLDLSLENKLAKRELKVLGQRIDLTRVRYPVYVMAGAPDHITPWKGCYRTTRLFGGPVQFVLTNQNHTQSISSRDDNKKLKYWIGRSLPKHADQWMTQVDEFDGSWIPHWINWLHEHNEGGLVPAPVEYGNENYPELDAAPGRYVVDAM